MRTGKSPRPSSLVLTPLVVGLLCVACPAKPPVVAPPAASSAEIRFCVREGAGHNCLLRDSTVAAHLLATSGKRARLVVAFPAENSGVAFWAASPSGGEVRLDLEEPIQSFQDEPRPDGSRLRGVRFVLRSSSPLDLEKILLGNIRLIRDYDTTRKLEYRDRVLEEWRARFGALPAALQAKLRDADPVVLKTRSRTGLVGDARGGTVAVATSLDGRHQLKLRLEVRGGRVLDPAEAPRLRGEGERLEIEVEASCTYPPYRGLTLDDLLRPSAREHLRRLQARPDLRTRYEPLAAALRSLAFLATDRKYLAGSYRFLTYFGRDTMMSVWLLQPALTPAAIEAGLQAVLDRLSPEGEVAHEESLGDQAVLERLEQWSRLAREQRLQELERQAGPLGAPVFDYKMVDDDFMLALLCASYLEDETVSAERAAAFLSRRGAAGRSNLEALGRNLGSVIRAAAAYAASGRAVDLIPIRQGITVGDWRDSQEGLGFGRYSASINAYLVPAALRASVRILNNQKIDRPALSAAVQRAAGGSGDLAARLGELAGKWQGARRHFEVRLPAEKVRERLAAFLDRGAPAPERPLLRRIEVAPGVQAGAGATGRASLTEVSFDALALNADASPVEVMHTDDAFAMLAEDTPPEELDRRLRKYEHAYPLGLSDRFGVYVASPVFSSRSSDWATFGRNHYHGTVVWSWQLILLQRGLMRQLARHQRRTGAESRTLATRLRAVLEAVARAEERVGLLRTSELWSVNVEGDRFIPAPFQASQFSEASNALQLWSDLNLAVDLERTRLGLLKAP